MNGTGGSSVGEATEKWESAAQWRLRFQEVLRENENRLRAARRESEERFRSLAESATDAIISIDQNREIFFWNRSAERVFQFSSAEMVGRPVSIIVPERYESRHQAGVHAALSTGHMRCQPGDVLPVVGRRKDGREIPLEMTLSSWQMNNNTYFTAILRDVSGKRRMQEQLRQAQKMEAIGRLASGVAHDFNNILSILLGNMDLAAMNLQDVGSVMADMRTAALRGKDLVRQLLSLGGHGHSRKRVFDPVPAIQEVATLMRSVLPPAIEWVEKMPEEGMTLCVDPTRFHQILLNLCTNAGQAMGEQGGVLEIVSGKAVLDDQEAMLLGVVAGEFLRLSVRDTGPGIPLDVQEKIFDPFFTTKTDGKGSGLGLSVVHWAVKECAGAIHLESVPGQGSRFTVFIPLADACQEPPFAADAQPVAPAQEEGRILFVDDEPALMHLGVRMLHALGYAAVGRTDPHQALDLFLTQPDGFAAVITDYAMPGLTGSALAGRIHGVRPTLPIFLATGRHQEMVGEKGERHGFAGIFLKPVALGDLETVLQEMFAGTRTEKRAVQINAGEGGECGGCAPNETKSFRWNGL